MSSDEELDEGIDLDDLDTDEAADLPVDPVSLAAYVLAFLALGVAVLRAVIKVLMGSGDSSFADALIAGGFDVVVSGAVGVLAVALAGLSLVRARSGVAVQEGVARTALWVGIGAVALSLVVLVLQVNAFDDGATFQNDSSPTFQDDGSPTFQDDGSGFTVP